REDIFSLEGNSNQLQPFLMVDKPPENLKETPPILSFQRKRDIEIPWEQVLGNSATAGLTSIASIREYFESSWGFSSGELTEEDLGKIKVEQGTWYRSKFDANGNPVAKKIEKGLVLQHGNSGRHYLILATENTLKSEDTLGPEDFDTLAKYEDAWNKKIKGVELVFGSEEKAKKYFTECEELDLRPELIERQYQELSIQKQFAEKVNKKVEEHTENLIKKILLQEAIANAPESLEKIQEQCLRLEMGKYNVNRRLHRLKSQAADLGYYLFLKDHDMTFPNTTEPKKVKAGELYSQFQRILRWTTDHTRSEKCGFLGWGRKKVKYSKQHSKEVKDYRKVDTSADVVVKKEGELRQAGFDVYIFQRTPKGFFTDEGMSLSSVIDRCDYNEEFRRKCAVFLPVYEESLTGMRVLTKYTIFKRPLKAMNPSILPRLTVVESLSYRTTWEKALLGELVNTINLAPGEQRTITLTKKFTQETTISKSSTSIFDITQSDSSDLASEMEDTTRREKENSSKMEVSTSVSGGWGPVSAQASASAGTSNSLKDFNQAINKTAKKAAQSLSQQNKQEVSTSSTAKTTVETEDKTEATVKNINEGRALNLMFYRINNKFKGGLYLDNLEFEVIPSLESIDGSGVYEARRYSLSELSKVVNEFQANHLPFDVKDKDGVTSGAIDTIRYLLHKEYQEPLSRKLSEKETQELSKKYKDTDKPSPSDADKKLDIIAAWVNAIAEWLRSITIDSQEPLEPQDLIITSPGLYLDTIVSANPSTEPYSEEMRRQEVRYRAAEVFAKQAEGLYQQALASRLSGSAGNCLTRLWTDATNHEIRLSLKQPLFPGKWHVLVDGEEKGDVTQTTTEPRTVCCTWNDNPDWFQDEALMQRIMLLEEESGAIVRFL
ncbi:MAG: hypothetical protein AB4063_06840, partial [Crocosphaera sp.]